MKDDLSKVIAYTNKAYTEDHLRTLTDLKSKVANGGIVTESDSSFLESIRHECRMMLKASEDEWTKEKYFYLLVHSDCILETIFLHGLTSMDMYSWSLCFSLLAREVTSFILKGELEHIEYVYEFLQNLRRDVLDRTNIYKPLKKVDEKEFETISVKMLTKDFECFENIIYSILRRHFFKETDCEIWVSLEGFCQRLRQTNITQEDVPQNRDALTLLAAEFVYSTIRKQEYIELLEAAANIGFTASILEKKLDENLYLEPLTDYLNGTHTILSSFAGAIKDLKQF